MAKWRLSGKSLDNLKGVDTRLIALVSASLINSPVDFTVFSGVRSKEEQDQLVRSGVSKTTQSQHLYGLAVDLVPIVDGKLSWDWEPVFTMTDHIAYVAEVLGITTNIVWGGVWDRTLTTIALSNAEKAVMDYIKRQQDKGIRAFIDGVHFEIKEYE